MEIQELTVAEEKQKVVRQILEGLPEWFGIAEAREDILPKAPDNLVLPRWSRESPSAFFV